MEWSVRLCSSCWFQINDLHSGRVLQLPTHLSLVRTVGGKHDSLSVQVKGGWDIAEGPFMTHNPHQQKLAGGCNSSPASHSNKDIPQ